MEIEDFDQFFAEFESFNRISVGVGRRGVYADPHGIGKN